MGCNGSVCVVDRRCGGNLGSGWGSLVDQRGSRFPFSGFRQSGNTLHGRAGTKVQYLKQSDEPGTLLLPCLIPQRVIWRPVGPESGRNRAGWPLTDRGLQRKWFDLRQPGIKCRRYFKEYKACITTVCRRKSYKRRKGEIESIKGSIVQIPLVFNTVRACYRLKEMDASCPSLL